MLVRAGFLITLGLIIIYFIHPSDHATTTLPLPAAADAFNPWNPGAKCVRKADFQSQMYSLCPGYIPHEWIYIDEYQANRTAKITNKARQIISRGECIVRQMRIYCAEAYRPCYNVTIPGYGDTAVAGQLCGYQCIERNASCYDAYVAFGVSPNFTAEQLTCDPVWSFDFGFPYAPLFPVYNGTYDGLIRVTVNANNATTGQPDYIYTNVTLPCYDQNKDIFAGYPTLFCPDGLYNLDYGHCAFNCPEPLTNDSEFDAAIVMLSIAGWFSFCLTAFLVVSFLMQPKVKLVYPASLTFYFIVCVMCLSFTWCFGSLVGYKKLWCHDDKTPNRWGDALCTMQGVTYVYFTLASAMWWLLIGIALLVTIAFSYKAQERQITSFMIFGKYNLPLLQSHIIEAMMHLFCWGVPLLIVIIALANQKIGYGGNDFWCTIHSSEQVKLTSGDSTVALSGVDSAAQYDLWNLILLTIPILIITFVGSIVMGLVFVFAWIKSKQCGKFLLLQWRLLVLMMLYIWIYSFVFSHHIVLAAQRHDLYDAYQRYVTCLLKVYVFYDNCHLDSTVNYPLWFIASFNVAAQGIFVFVIYGTAKGPYQAWARLFRRYVLAQVRSESEQIGGTGVPKKTVIGRKYENTQDLDRSAHMCDDEDFADEIEDGEREEEGGGGDTEMQSMHTRGEEEEEQDNAPSSSSTDEDDDTASI